MEGKIGSFKDLLIWQKAMVLSKEIYLCSLSFPENEVFGLQSQIRRSAVSIPSNISEGWGRKSQKSYLNFLRIARGSLCELETQLILAHDFSYIEREQFDRVINLIVEESKMLNSLINKIELNNI